MKRIILIIIGCFILTGCSVNYDIHFDEDVITESIEATMEGNIYEIANSIEGDGFYYQKELVENEIPAIKDYSDYYNKKINVYGNSTKINLDYEYNYEIFKDSYLLNRCFERVNVVNDKDYLYVSLGGNFQCFDFENDDIKINLTSEYKVINHNADSEDNGKYSWNIKMADEENKIEFQIAKNLDEKTNNIFNVLKILLVIIMIITGGLIYVFKKNFRNYD